jgi:hypothetical protein
MLSLYGLANRPASIATRDKPSESGRRAALAGINPRSAYSLGRRESAQILSVCAAEGDYSGRNSGGAKNKCPIPLPRPAWSFFWLRKARYRLQRAGIVR